MVYYVKAPICISFRLLKVSGLSSTVPEYMALAEKAEIIN